MHVESESESNSTTEQSINVNPSLDDDEFLHQTSAGTTLTTALHVCCTHKHRHGLTFPPGRVDLWPYFLCVCLCVCPSVRPSLYLSVVDGRALFSNIWTDFYETGTRTVGIVDLFSTTFNSMANLTLEIGKRRFRLRHGPI